MKGYVSGGFKLDSLKRSYLAGEDIKKNDLVKIENDMLYKYENDFELSYLINRRPKEIFMYKGDYYIYRLDSSYYKIFKFKKNFLGEYEQIEIFNTNLSSSYYTFFHSDKYLFLMYQASSTAYLYSYNLETNVLSNELTISDTSFWFIGAIGDSYIFKGKTIGYLIKINNDVLSSKSISYKEFSVVIGNDCYITSYSTTTSSNYRTYYLKKYSYDNESFVEESQIELFSDSVNGRYTSLYLLEFNNNIFVSYSFSGKNYISKVTEDGIDNTIELLASTENSTIYKLGKSIYLFTAIDTSLYRTELKLDNQNNLVLLESKNIGDFSELGSFNKGEYNTIGFNINTAYKTYVLSKIKPEGIARQNANANDNCNIYLF